MAISPNDWDTNKRLARLHGMAFALKIDSIDVITNLRGPLKGREYYGDNGWRLPHRPALPTTDEAKQKAAQKHLDQAIYWYERALQVSPDHPLALLGYGWCLEQNGEIEGAKDAYRKLVDRAFELPNEELERARQYATAAGWALEGIEYLIGLLDPVLERTELEKRGQQLGYLEEHRVISMSPVAIPLRDGLDPVELLDDEAQVEFDLDGSGRHQRWTWISPDAAWLVHDFRGVRNVESGRDLFGNVTFFLFWNNGYEAIASLDDNMDGELRGDELWGLGLWHDRNINGVCEGEEFQDLLAYGIVGLRYSCEQTEVGTRYIWSCPDGAVLADGTARPTYDFLLERRDWAKSVLNAKSNWPLLLTAPGGGEEK